MARAEDAALSNRLGEQATWRSLPPRRRAYLSLFGKIEAHERKKARFTGFVHSLGGESSISSARRVGLGGAYLAPSFVSNADVLILDGGHLVWGSHLLRGFSSWLGAVRQAPYSVTEANSRDLALVTLAF